MQQKKLMLEWNRLQLESGNFNIDEVELNEQEKEQAIKEAVTEALKKKRNDLYFESLNVVKEYSKASPKQLYNMALNALKYSVPNFNIEKVNVEILKTLCKYFSGDKSFEDCGEGYSLDKGIYLWGNVGTGKSTMMSLFSLNQHQPYKFRYCEDICDDFSKLDSRKSEEKREVITKHSRLFKINDSYQHAVTKHDYAGICFDDLGVESDQNDFGKINIMETIMMNRYKAEDIPFNCTHVTSNLGAEQIEERYGLRVRDRFKQMFNTIGFPSDAKSLR